MLDYIHVDYIYPLIMNVILEYFAKDFCSKSNGFVVQTCMLSRLLSMQFAFVIIGHDLY
jgi:hypothetical protein